MRARGRERNYLLYAFRRAMSTRFLDDGRMLRYNSPAYGPAGGIRFITSAGRITKTG